MNGRLGSADPEAIRQAGLGGGRITLINETTRSNIRQLVKQAIDDGLSPQQAGDLVEKWTGFDEYRAERIARTEMMFAYNSAALGTYKDFGVTHVQAIDGDTDAECLDRNGRIYTVSDAGDIHDHPNGTLDWVPIAPDYRPEAQAQVVEPEPDYYQPARLPGQVDLRLARSRAQQIQRAGTHPGGDSQLSALYEQQGFDSLPQVLSKAEIDAYIAKGEQEIYRGMRNLGEDFAEQYRTGSYYPGTGIYGNGTYAAEAGETIGMYNTGQLVAKQYASTDGTILRMTIRSDARTITYTEARDGAYKAVKALENQRGALEQGLADFRAELYNRPEYKFSNLNAMGDDAANALLRQRQATYDKEFERVALRKEEVETQIEVFQDPGRWATFEGYDAIDVATQDPYWVILNRSATRVERENWKSWAAE